MYNTIYIRMVVGGERYGGYNAAVQALRALALLEEEGIPVRRGHLQEAQNFYGGRRFGGPTGDHIFAMEGAWWNAGDRYSTDVSTSRDLVFRAQMEKNLNKVAGKVCEYVEPGDLADQILIEFEEGDNKHMVLFKGNRAYLAAWNYLPGVGVVNANVIHIPQQITDMTVFRVTPDIGADMLLTLTGRSARDHVAAAFRMNAVQDMLERVRARKPGVSFRTAVREWSQAYMPGYRGWGRSTFMYRQNTRWVDIKGYAQETLAARFEDAIRELREPEMAEMDTGAVEQGAAFLSELRRIAGRAYDLSKKYADYLRWGDEPRPGDAIAAETVAEVGELPQDADALTGGEGDICFDGDCGGIIAAVVGVNGINDIPGVGFGDRLGMMLAAHMRAVEAAIAAYQGNQGISGLTADQKQELFQLQSEISGILGAFRSHVGGRLQQIRGEMQMLAYRAQLVQPNNAVIEESHRILSGMASDIAVLAGLLADLKPEELHVAARELRYSYMSKKIKIGGKKVTGMMVRMKEKGKRSFYAWLC